MGIFDQVKLFGNLMKNMDPSQMKDVLSQAQEMKKMLDEQIKQGIEEEIKRRGLITRKEVEELLNKKSGYDD